MPYLASDTRYDTMLYNRTGNSGLKLPPSRWAGGTTSAAVTTSRTAAPLPAGPSTWASRISTSPTTTVRRPALPRKLLDSFSSRISIPTATN